MKGLLTTLGAIVLVGVILVVLGLGYLGFVPGVSSLFGSNKPRDLNAAYTEADLQTAQGKLQQTLVEPSVAMPADIIRNAGTSQVTAQLAGKEWAAHIDAMHPVRNVQVVFHNDGTFEATGQIEKDRIVPFARMLGFTEVTESDIMSYVDKYLPGNPVFYLKGSGEITNNESSMSLKSVEVGRLPVDPDWAGSLLEQYADALLDTVPGLDVSDMRVVNGQLQFEGTVPKSYPRW